MKVFISYNHKDQPTALQIKDQLVNAGFEVIIDIDKLKAGQPIDQFILECIRESDATISLISQKSLLSAWVAMETFLSTVDEKLRSRYFVPCYIDNEFFDLGFTGKALDTIDQQLSNIDTLIRTALDKNRGIEDLQSERTRLSNLKANLPQVIQKFRNSLCVDLTPDNFDRGMKKIITDLKEREQVILSLPVVAAANTKQELLQQIGRIIDETSRQRLETLNKRLATQQQLLEQYEEKADLEDDPRIRMKHDKDITRTKQDIQKILDEIKTL